MQAWFSHSVAQKYLECVRDNYSEMSVAGEYPHPDYVKLRVIESQPLQHKKEDTVQFQRATVDFISQQDGGRPRITPNDPPESGLVSHDNFLQQQEKLLHIIFDSVMATPGQKLPNRCDEDDRRLLFLFYTLQKSGNAQLTAAVADQLDTELNFHLLLSPYDFYVIQYCLSKTVHLKKMRFLVYHQPSEFAIPCVLSVASTNALTAFHLGLSSFTLSSECSVYRTVRIKHHCWVGWRCMWCMFGNAPHALL